MFQLDENLLRELGLGDMPAAEKNKMLAHIYETLELRVGMKLAEQMTDAQLDEFEGFIDRNDEAGALKWLETNFPHYKDVVAEELEKLKNEIKAQAPAIMQATVAEQGQAAQPQPTAPTDYSQPNPQPPVDPTMQQPPVAPQPPQQPGY
jgi:hypothetical protein